MPPRKRWTDELDSVEKPDTATAATKRRRVSLACDGCRTAREKCDGGRPHCGRCVSQNRPCSYTPASKKRGIQSGYLRAIELSLAWLLESNPDCEKTLYQLLVKDDGKDGANILMSKGKAANKLHKQWSKCRVHKDIESLLCQSGTQRVETSNTEDSDTEGDVGEESTSITRLPLATSHPADAAKFDQAYSLKEPKSVRDRALRLPSNHQHLLEIYFAYTHCWLPILDREQVFATAAICITQGQNITGFAGETDIAPSSLAVLWSAMAVAAFQDAHSSAPPISEEIISPVEIFTVAHSLIPQEEDHFIISDIQAILLHSIILIGRESMLAASLIAGKVMRLISYIQSRRAYQTNSDVQRSTLAKLGAACNLVETLTSMCIGQPSHLLDTEDLQTAELSQHGSSFSDSFCPTYGFGKLSLMLNLPTHQNGSVKAVAVGDLVSSLNSQFSFYNSVITGETTPMLPSAFLAQAMFLATTVELVPGQRSSLISNFLEVVESSITNFGACGTSPITVALFLLVQQKGIMDEMRTSEANRWNSALNTIKAVWLQQETTKSTLVAFYKRGESHTDSVDYDAILEELGNIDYADSIDVDPQFMMNLGFAPGCNLEEMFHADSGV
ncbi:hypothetical protein V8C34DRAFT_324489 [Trichoderma compactum]